MKLIFLCLFLVKLSESVGEDGWGKNQDLNQTISEILEEMEDMRKNIIRNEEKISKLSTRGTWCGYTKGAWNTTGTIFYDRLLISDTNRKISKSPLDIKTGE